MCNDTPNEFPQEIHEHIAFYIYRLIDPRNGETFYIGKGKGNRVFTHVAQEKATQTSADNNGNESILPLKLDRIRAIQNAGLSVIHVIHRHGIKDPETAYQVEAALIDATPGLTNIAGGWGSNEYGPMNAEEIIKRYATEEAEFEEGQLILLINVNQSSESRSLYEAVRYAWRINAKKASKATMILATNKGMIIGAFKANEWKKATPKNFPGHEALPSGSPGRWGFEGEGTECKHVNKRIPNCIEPSQNPIRYWPVSDDAWRCAQEVAEVEEQEE